MVITDTGLPRMLQEFETFGVTLHLVEAPVFNAVMRNLMDKVFLVAFPGCLCHALLLTPSPALFLRSKPAQVSRAELIAIIQQHDFNHPMDVSEAGLSVAQFGTLRHRYEVQIYANVQALQMRRHA